MFKRVMQSIAFCLLMTSLVTLSDADTYNSTEITDVVQEIEPIEVVMLEPTHVKEEKIVVGVPHKEVVVKSGSVDEMAVIKNPKPVESEITMSKEDIELIALVTMAEAEGESELGQRLVIDVILNQIDSDIYPNTASGVVYAPNAFSSMWNGRVEQCYVDEHICQLVREELISRTNSEVLFFRTKHYHSFGTPILQEGNHYFSGI